MKVVLTADVKGTGKKGELCTVSDGYARNFLFPRGLATEANTTAMNELKNREASKSFHKQEALSAAEADRAAIDGKTVTLSARAGESGKLFGAVTAKEVAAAIGEQLQVTLDRHKLNMKDIKAHGEYAVEVKLHPGMVAKLTVVVGE